MTTHHFETLRGAVLAASRAGTWAQAVQEWQIISVEEEPLHNGICVCGKTELFYLYKIHNQVTQQDLFLIGSKCVNLFEVEELDLSVTVLHKLLKLRSAFASHQDVELTSEFFSRAVLADLWQNDAFPPTNTIAATATTITSSCLTCSISNTSSPQERDVRSGF